MSCTLMYISQSLAMEDQQQYERSSESNDQMIKQGGCIKDQMDHMH